MHSNKNFQNGFQNEEELDIALSEPGAAVVELMRETSGDFIFLGVAGKMGVTLALMAKRAAQEAGVKKRIVGVARFSDQEQKRKLENAGIETISCDLLDPEAVAKLPDAPNVVYMAAKKFGTDGNEDVTWAMNVVAPTHVIHRYKKSRIVAFSTGCVYPLVTATQGGCDENVKPAPIGDYDQSALGRERVFGYASRVYGTPVCLYRLNYAVDLRYGVLHDIAQTILAGRPVDLSASHFNAIWQGDANRQALLCLRLASSPAVPVNITGPETVSVKYAATLLAEHLGKGVSFQGEPGGAVYLNNASFAAEKFGYPSVSMHELIRLQAAWLKKGGRSLGKPTHFEVTTGKY